jgi:ketosteroid isomerase-like protein
MQRDLERVEEIYEAYAKDDLATLLLLMGQEVEIVQSAELPWGGHYVGHDGMRQFLGALAQHLDSSLFIERLIDAGDQIVAVGRTAGKTRKTGLEFDIPLVQVWAFSDGQVTRFETYIDNATILAALDA